MVSKVLKFLRLGEADQPQLPAPPSNGEAMHVTEIGSTGSQNFAGYPHEEYLRELQGRARADVFDKMRRSDAQVTMLLAAVKNPIKAASWMVEPYRDPDTDIVTPEAEADADLIEQILFRDMAPGWDQFIEEALTMVDFGHSVFEVTHKVVLGHPKFGSYNSVSALGFRSQRTIERWNLDRQTGGLLSISQYAFGDLQRLVEIPAQFLLLYSIGREGSNYEGISLLRPCYGNYFRKALYLKLNAVGIEKFAVPTPIGEVPDGKENTPQEKNFINAMKAYAQHKANYLSIPAGWKMTLQQNSYDPAKVETSIDNEDRRMAKAFLANLLELGSSSGSGSYALGSVLGEFFEGAIEHIARKLESPINLDLIPALIKMNKGERDGYPKLKHAGISDKLGRELAESFKFLADAQYITPDDPTEEHIRKRLNLPPMSSEGQRSVVPKGSLGSPGAAPSAPPPSGQGDGQFADLRREINDLRLSERIKLAREKIRPVK